MKRYQKYKNINLPWYPNGVPDHWNILRHKNVLSEHREYVGNDSEKYTLLSLTLNGVIIRDISEGKGKFSKEYDKYVIVDQGDLIFCLFDVEETPRTVGLSKYNGMITGAYDIFKPHNINSEYFYYYYLSLDNAKALKPLYSGLRKVIPYPSFMATKFPVPPRPEQDQIVRYLNWKISQIDKLIHGYKKQIKLLEERLSTSICHYTFNGMEKDRDYSCSIYPWIEKVPNGWTETKLKRIAKKLEHPVRPSDELLICSNKGKVFFRGDSKMGLVADSDDIYQGVRRGDLLIHGMDTWHGAIAISDFDGKCTPVVHVCDSNENKRYLSYFLRALAFKKIYKKISNGVRENTSDFRSWLKAGEISVLVPPIEEQNQIADFLDRQTELTENLIDKLNQKVAILREHKSRLISDVVTGQVDVRDVIIPDYAAEPYTEDPEKADENEESEVTENDD